MQSLRRPGTSSGVLAARNPDTQQGLRVLGEAHRQVLDLPQAAPRVPERRRSQHGSACVRAPSCALGVGDQGALQLRHHLLPDQARQLRARQRLLQLILLRGALSRMEEPQIGFKKGSELCAMIATRWGVHQRALNGACKLAHASG